MLHGSETWPVRKENEVALQRAEMRMVRWMCDVKVKDKSSKQGGERKTRNRLYNLGTTGKQVATDVLQKEDTDWVKKCMEYEVEGSKSRDQRRHGERLCKKIAKHVI